MIDAISSSRRRNDILVAGAVFLICALVPLLTFPTAAAAFNDDFSYARMAVSVARTGTFQYDGWATTQVGPQAYWGALFVRLFGESAFVLRLSTMVLAGACAVVIYRIGRQLRLERGPAIFAALLTMLSPVAIPLSASFMTDIPGLFFSLLALSLALAVSHAEGTKGSLLFTGFVIAGLIGGMIRQNVWMVVLAVGPILLFRPAICLKQRLTSSALLIAFVAIVVWNVRHHRTQDYVPAEDLGQLVRLLFTPQHVVRQTLSIAMTLALLLLPLSIALLPLAKRFRGWFLLPIALSAIVAAVYVTTTTEYHWLGIGNMTTIYGVLKGGVDVMGERPAVVPPIVVLVLKSVCFLSVGMLAAILLRLWPGDTRQRISEFLRSHDAICAAYVVSAIALLVSRRDNFDRYVLPVLPVIAIGLLRIKGRGHLLPSSILLAIWTMAGLAFTFEYHAALRGRVAAVDRLLAAGVPRSSISAGFEIDAAVQLELRGYLNDPRITRPANAVFLLETNPAWNGDLYWFWSKTPEITPDYLVARAEVAGFEDAGLGEISIRSVLPPYHRTLRILRRINRTTPPLVPQLTPKARPTTADDRS